MPNKTLYVRDEDMSGWLEAEKEAKRDRRSMSQLVSLALAEYLAARRGQKA